MMFSPLAALAVFVACASAITITSPGASQSWTNNGEQTITWTAVQTDPQNFAITLTNTNTTLIPTVDNNQVLKALVDTSTGTTTVSPPASGWPSPGGSYRVNFCNSTEDLSTIYAQSDPFNIVAAAVQSDSSTATSQTLASTPTTPATTPTGSATVTDAGDASGSGSSSAPASTGSSAAPPALGIHTGFVSVLVVLGAFLA
ncbi:GPI-anchored small secreted protein [Mycena maculata]|uniref:GPI-anchored small secreted protein n=1 Tax=Mycena maculata TaxID=230809 RepID=A0AAD7HI80_9AGAR|nr:GPI-anchored small secreted protein [Mycena maculata]